MYCDATIACDGQFYPVHKLVLSTCSEYFEQIFEVADKQHLMIVLADIQHEDLETLLDYMYMGEVNVMQSDLSGFMKAAECLKIKGLAEPMETNPRKEYIESKRSYSRREDGWESKRRKQNDETSGYSFSESKTIQRSSSDSPGPVKVPMGNEESYIEPKRHKDKMGEHTKTSISTTGIISPLPLLASAEVTSKTLLGLGPDFLPTLSRCHEGSASCDGEITDCDSSQVKFEDVNVKEEPEDWSQGGCTGDSQLFRFSDPGLTCLANTSTLPVAAPDSWEFDRVTKAQPGPLNHPASSVPGPSGSQSMPEEEHEAARSMMRKAALNQKQAAVSINTNVPEMLDADVFLTAKEEKFVIDWLKMSDDLGFAHLKDDLLNIVQRIFMKKERKTPFSNNLPNNSWYSRFLKRHPSITSKIHKENLILKSTATFDALKLWYSNLEMFLTEIGSQDILNDASRIYSAGSIIFPMNANAGTVFDPRSVNDRTPRVLSQFVSVFETISASGKVSPGTVVFPDEAIPGFVSKTSTSHAEFRTILYKWHISSSPCGTIQSENLLDYLETVFIPWLHREHIKTPVILFLHGHYRTLITPELCRLCKNKVVIVHSLHPYTVQLKQVPVMTALLDPLRLAWTEKAQEWKSETKNHFLSYYGFFIVLSRVLKKVVDSHKIRQAFQISGLYPFKLIAGQDC